MSLRCVCFDVCNLAKSNGNVKRLAKESVHAAPSKVYSFVCVWFVCVGVGV
jgi:hypothetical protein